jgi:hypothetical protein
MPTPIAPANTSDEIAERLSYYVVKTSPNGAQLYELEALAHDFVTIVKATGMTQLDFLDRISQTWDGVSIIPIQ